MTRGVSGATIPAMNIDYSGLRQGIARLIIVILGAGLLVAAAVATAAYVVIKSI